jgi:hypothetical protein
MAAFSRALLRFGGFLGRLCDHRDVYGCGDCSRVTQSACRASTAKRRLRSADMARLRTVKEITSRNNELSRASADAPMKMQRTLLHP